MSDFRSGLVALAGRPNVGKSTLANALAQTHVAAVSPRPQTTRRRVRAIVNGDEWQAVLIDMPGFQKPTDGLTRRMQDAVDGAFDDCDLVIFMVNAREALGAGDRFIAQRMAVSGLPVVLVVNKIDGLPAEQVARTIAEASRLVDFVELHPVSASEGTGLAELRETIGRHLPAGPRYFPPGVATDQTDEEIAAELIREAALQRVREEVPHAIAVQIDAVEPAGVGRIIRAAILVETESQKGIVVGKGGRMIRAIGEAARINLAHVFGEPVHTDLMVKVRPKWRRDESMLDRLGL